jgi:Family of unknown function (DUF5681)
MSGSATRGLRQPTSGSWKPGQSGNPAGKKPGTRNRKRIAADRLLAEASEDLTRQAIAMALKGDAGMLKVCLDRLVPVARKAERYIKFKLPSIARAEDLVHAVSAVTTAVSERRLALDDLGPLISLFEVQVEAIKLNDHEDRIAALETYAGNKEGLRVVA